MSTESTRRCRHERDHGGAVENEDEQSEGVRATKAPLTWSERLRRVFGIEITVCPHCGGRLRLIGDVTDPEVIDQILEQVRREGLPRAPPMRSDFA